MSRQNKYRGDVASHVDKNFKYKVVEKITTVAGNILECITIEICMEQKKNCICELYI